MTVIDRGRMRRAVRSWRPHVRALVAGDGLLGRFAYLVLTQGVTVLLGIGYWTLSTRLVPTRSVGLAAAAVSTATFLSALGALGVGSLLLAELGHMEETERRRVATGGVLAVSVASGLLALGAWALSPFLGHNLSVLGRQPLDAGLLVVGTMCTGVASVLDMAAVGMRKSRLQLVRNAVTSALRLVLVLVAVLVGAKSTTALLVAWTLSLALSFVVWRRLNGGWGGGEYGWRTGWAQVPATLARYRSLALRHHVLNLAITSVAFFLPMIAAVLLVPRDFAYFATAQLISSTALLAPALLAMTLFAEATGDPASLRRHVRRTLPIGFACCLGVLVVFEPLAHQVLSVFGPAYSEHGASTLRLLLLGGLFYVVKDHYVAIRRAQRRLTEAAKVVAAATSVEALFAAGGAVLFGVEGLCGFWVLATALEALLFAPVVWRVVKDPGGGSAALARPDYSAPSEDRTPATVGSPSGGRP